MRTSPKAIALALAILAAGAGPAVAASITEFATDSATANPVNVALDDRGRVWFPSGAGHEGSGEGRPRVAALDPRTGRVGITVTLPQRPLDVLFVGGAIWGQDVFTNRLLRVDLNAGTSETIPIDGIPRVADLAASPDGRTLFVGVPQAGGYMVGPAARILAVDTITRTARIVYVAPMDVFIADVAAAPDGTVWVMMNRDLAKDVRVAPINELTLAHVDPAKGTAVVDVVPGNYMGAWVGADAKGAWLSAHTQGFSEQRPDLLLRHVDGVTGAVDATHRLDPRVTAPPRGFVTTRDGSLWFSAGSVIGRLAGGRIELLPIPTAQTDGAVGAGGMVAAPDGRTLWFGQYESGNIGRVDSEDTGPSVGNATTVAQHGLGTVVSCRSACRGVATAFVSVPRAARARAARPRKVALGRTSFRAAAGHVTLQIGIRKRRRALLTRGMGRRLTVKMRIREGRGRRTVTQRLRVR